MVFWIDTMQFDRYILTLLRNLVFDNGGKRFVYNYTSSDHRKL